MSGAPTSTLDYATALDFVTETSDSLRDGGGATLEGWSKPAKSTHFRNCKQNGSRAGNVLDAQETVGTAGDEFREAAAVPTVWQNNTGALTTGTTERNLNQLNLYRSGAYDSLTIDVNPDSSGLAKSSKPASKRARYIFFSSLVDPSLFARHCFVKKGRVKDTFCIKIDCKTAHKGGRTPTKIVPGEAFVQKDKENRVLPA